MESADLARQHGVSEATIYSGNANYRELEVDRALRLRTLEAESAEFQRLLVDTMVDQTALKDVLAKCF